MPYLYGLWRLANADIFDNSEVFMNNIGDICSLRIIYEVEGRLEATYISEFFKLCGIMVVEHDVPAGGISEKIVQKDYRGYDKHLLLSMKEEGYERFFWDYSDRCVMSFLSVDFEQDFKSRNYEVLYQRLSENIEQVIGYKSKGLASLAQLYVDKDFFLMSYKKRNFLYEICESEREKLKNVFKEIVNEFSKNSDLINEYADMPYLRYAKVLCAKKVNEVHTAMNKEFVYSIASLLNECIRILERYPYYAGAYMLAATLCSCDNAYSGDVLPFYNKIIRRQENMPYMAPIYYRFGQYLEKKRGETVRANRLYEKAVQVVPQYFRAVFKVASKYLDERDYGSAIQGYKKVIELIENKYKEKKLFTIEIEYLCKCYLLIGIIYEHFLNSKVLARKCFKYAIEIEGKDLRKYPFLDIEDNSDTEKYRNYLRERISIREHSIVRKYI